MKTGDNIKFTAQRIFHGNPVIGKLISDSDEWIDIELDHDLEGMNNVSYRGETKKFRKSLIIGEITILP